VSSRAQRRFPAALLSSSTMPSRGISLPPGRRQDFARASSASRRPGRSSCLRDVQRRLGRGRLRSTCRLQSGQRRYLRPRGFDGQQPVALQPAGRTSPGC